MKKLLVFLLAVAMTLCFASCSSNGGSSSSSNHLIALADNEVLNVGNNSFMNYEDETETVQTLTVTLSVTYTLNRSYYESYSDAVYYNGYYYYWTIENTTETQTLGKATTKNVYTYSYLPYGENEKVLVKTTTARQTTYDYEGGWVEKPITVDTNLNGYFASFSKLESDCPDLAKTVKEAPTSKKYYVDVTTPDSTTSSKNFYDTYFYVEKK